MSTNQNLVHQQNTVSTIRFEGVTQAFPSQNEPVFALKNVSFTVGEKEFLSIIGPSGCGKSTILKLIAGLEPVTQGAIYFAEQKIERLNCSVGYVTQENNLLPWLTLRQNVELPLLIQGVPPAERHDKVSHFMDLVGLMEFADHFPHQLSGGMHKRGAIIRTLIQDPDVILMDEPFGPLDAQTRTLLQQDLLEIWSSQKKTIVFITHDLGEAVTLSDRVLVMTRRPGSIKQDLPIHLPRPRNVIDTQDEPEYLQLYHQLWESLMDELPLMNRGVRRNANAG